MTGKKREKMMKAARVMAVVLIAAMVVTYSIQIFAYLMW
jgi:hypothetical protein